MHTEERKGSKTPSVRIRARRLSLEGSNQGKKDNLQVKVPESVSNLEQPLEAFGHSSNGSSTREEEVYNYQKAPKSPVSSAYKSRVAQAATRTQITPFQPTRTPEPESARKEAQIIMQSGLSVSKDSEPPSFISSGNGKGSQIRKSLRTIGKLINGSEKRYFFIYIYNSRLGVILLDIL